MSDEGEENEAWMKLVPPDVRIVPLGKEKSLEDQIAERIRTLKPPGNATPAEETVLTIAE